MAKKNVTPVEETVVQDEMTEAVVVAAPNALAEEEFDIDYSQVVVKYDDKHKGQELKLDAQDVIIPTLRIVQELSQVFKAYKGREQERPFELGDIYDSSTGKFYSGKTGVLLVPIELTRHVIERLPSPKGTFVAKLEVKDARVQAAFAANGKDGWKKLTALDNTKNQLVYTDEVLVALLDPRDGVTAVSVAAIPCSGKNVWPRKQWWNAIASTANTEGVARYNFRTLLKTEFVPGKDGGADAYKFKAEPYKADWNKSRLPAVPVTNAEGKVEFVPTAKAAKSLDACLTFLNLYSTGVLGRADYSDADSDESESAREAAAFSDKPAF